MTRVAVAITCFNQSAYTVQAVRSLLEFTRSSVEVSYDFKIFDDCSFDGTEEVVRECFGDRVGYWKPAKNSGLTNLWNAAYREYVNFDYIVLSNNDVIFTPGWSHILLSEMQEHGSSLAGPVTNGPGHVDAQDVRNFLDDYVPSDAMEDILATSQRLADRESFRTARINGFCMAFRKSLLAQADTTGSGTPFDPRFRLFGNEDEFQARLAPRPLIVPKCFVFHYKRVSISDRPRPFHVYRGRILQ